jgi:hypothetical protein
MDRRPGQHRPGRFGQSRSRNGTATAARMAKAIAVRVAWNCHNPLSAAITRT